MSTTQIKRKNLCSFVTDLVRLDLHAEFQDLFLVAILWRIVPRFLLAIWGAEVLRQEPAIFLRIIDPSLHAELSGRISTCWLREVTI